LDRELDEVKRALVGRLHNNGAPLIYIELADESGLYLRHDESDDYPLDDRYAKETLKYIFAVWKHPVVLSTYDQRGKFIRYEANKDGITTESKAVDGSNSVRFQI
jgi:spore cortex formation protein SpoVR/YcgB (stage V sporulation)